MDQNLHDYRKSYQKGALDKASVDPNPLQQFRTWFYEAKDAGGSEEVNAMTLTTLGLDGFPKGRIVLLKKYDENGFYFYTNYSSEKGQALIEYPKASLAFFWPTLERQVLIKGNVVKTSRADSENYFASRPLGSQLGAIVSNQSSEISDRTVLEERLEQLEAKYGQNNSVQCPEDWGGFLVKPKTIEFWQGRPNRLHDRIVYDLDNQLNWNLKRLAP